jgi:hypothetical protein
VKMPKMTLGARPAGRQGRAESSARAASRGAVVPQVQVVIGNYGPGLSWEQKQAAEMHCLNQGGVLTPCHVDLFDAFEAWEADDDGGPWNYPLCCWADSDDQPPGMPPGRGQGAIGA